MVKVKSTQKKTYLLKKLKIVNKSNVSFIKDFTNNNLHKKHVYVVNKVIYKF